jgi:hypothetical protein
VFGRPNGNPKAKNRHGIERVLGEEVKGFDWKWRTAWSRLCKMGSCTGTSILSSLLIFVTTISIRQALL